MLLHAPWGGSLDGVTVLDGFAGTGALGLEALSRGAAAAWFIEKDRAALTALRANVAACGAGTVLAADILRPPPGRPCGLVFLDPPYGQGLLPLALAALGKAGWLAPDATIVAEAAADETPALGALLAERRHGAGRVTIWLRADHVER
jgi:16S rRNA (guanine966-N2)-methyltransferase